MAQDFNILLGAKLDDSAKTQQTLNAQINELSERLNKLNLKIDNKLFTNLTNEFKQLSNQLNSSFSTGNLSKQLDKIQQQYTHLEDGSVKINKTVTETTNKHGERVKLVEKLNKETGKLQQTETVITNNVKQRRLEQEKLNQSQSKYWASVRKEKLTGLTSKSKELQEMSTYYKQLEKQSRSVANFQKQMQLNSQKLVNQFGEKNVNTEALNKFNKEVQNLSTTTPNATQKMDKLKHNFKEIEMNAKKASTQTKSWGKELLSSASKFGQWMVIGTMIMQPIRAIRQGIEDLKEIDAELTQLRKVTGETLDTMSEFAFVANDIGSSLGATTQEVIKATTEFARLGYSIEEASTLAEESILFSTVGNMSVEQASKSLISTIKAFGIEVDKQGQNVRRVIDQINEVG